MKNEAKEYLNQIRFIDLSINSRQAELENLKASFLGSQELQHDKISASRGNNQEDKFIRYVELSKSIDETIDELWDVKMEIGKEIDQLESEKEILVLRERYILGKQWKEIADFIKCSERTVYRLHGEALNSFNEFLKNKEESKEKDTVS